MNNSGKWQKSQVGTNASKGMGAFAPRAPFVTIPFCVFDRGCATLVLIATINIFVVPGLSAAATPLLAPPSGTTSLVSDAAGNFWALAPTSDGRRELVVLPAQAPGAWSPARIQNIEPGDWMSVTTRPDRGVVVANSRQARRFDLRFRITNR